MRKTLVAIGPLALVVLVACADDEVEKDLTPATTVDCPTMDSGARSTPPGMTPTTPPAADASSPTSGVQETTYVLVHGGGHGGWCYQRVARLLRKAGHNVYTPTMTGVGERAHLLTPDVNLDTQITDVVKLLEYEDLTDVVLVGHSFGGMVISGIGDRATRRIGKIVFLDAIRPENGQALYPANAPGGVQMVNGVEVALLPSEALVTQLGVTDPADAKWVLSKLTPHPWKALSQPLQLMNEAGLRAIPEYEINAAPHPPNPNAKRVWHVDTGHDMMITHPDIIAHILLSLAKGAQPTDDYLSPPDGGTQGAPAMSDPRCPDLNAGSFKIASCCTPQGQCGINDTFMGMGCLDLAEVSRLAGQMGMGMGAFSLPAPRVCDGASSASDAGAAADARVDAGL